MPAPHFEQTEASSEERLPLRFGRSEDFGCIEAFLRRTGYTEENLCRILRIPEICDFGKLNPDTFVADPQEPEALVLLIRVFFLLQEAPARKTESCIPGDVVEVLQGLDLLRCTRSNAPTFYSSVWLYPVETLILASDRNKDLQDAVFPAISPLSYRFLKRMSRSPASEALDLCSGSGVAAMLLSQHCERVIASDVSARAVHFAKFNCQLNRCNQVKAVESNFYSALDGKTFDRIVAHPPYVPSLSNAVVWRDGGATGEEPIRRIVAGLPQFLCSGGTFYAACGGFDTKDQTLEHRVRSWLGPSHGLFDVLFAVEFDKSPWHLAVDSRSTPTAHSEAGSQRLLERFSEIGALNFVTGSLVIYRRTEAETSLPREPLTLRAQLSPMTDGSCFDTSLRWWRWLGPTQSLEALGQLKPRLGSTLRVNITHVVQDQELVAAAFLLESSQPFHAESKVDPEMVQVLLRCDGNTSLTEIFQIAREASLIPENLPLPDFLKFGAKMIERGYLEIDPSVLDPS